MEALFFGSSPTRRSFANKCLLSRFADLLCGIMSAKDRIGCAEKKRPLKHRFIDWRRYNEPSTIIFGVAAGERPLRCELIAKCCKIFKKP